MPHFSLFPVPWCLKLMNAWAVFRKHGISNTEKSVYVHIYALWSWACDSNFQVILKYHENVSMYHNTISVL